jgi:hypothetical protein
LSPYFPLKLSSPLAYTTVTALWTKELTQGCHC